jgi:hypothetical protein
MKLIPVAALALFAAAPAFANNPFVVDFEQNWAYGTTVDSAYQATAGVTFTNVIGLSNNDGLGNLPNGDYYANAPTMTGIAMVQLDGNVNTTAYMNVAAGTNNLSFFYSSPTDVAGAVIVYSGLNGTGSLLGTINLAANSQDYSHWTQVTLAYSGTAQSFDFTASANVVGLDNITAAVPEPETYAMLLVGLGVLGAAARRNRRA